MTNERITTADEWHVIHAGKEIGPLSRTDLFAKALAGEVEADDLVKKTGELWTPARDFDFLQPQFLRQDSTEQPGDKTCFFCQSAPTEDPLSVSLYKITQRTNTYVVVGMSCETQYVTTKVEVPKCRDCEKKTLSSRAGMPATRFCGAHRSSGLYRFHLLG